MANQPETVLKDLKSGKYAPVYFLQGDEPYFIDLITGYIEEHAIPEHEKGFNQIIMYGKESNMNTVLTNARRFPMMADRQVVIVKEAQNIPDLGKEAGDNLLINYIKNPLPSTILVFSHKYKVLDGRKALAKELDKKAILVKSAKVPEYKLSPWVDAYIKSKKFTIDPKASQIITESIGNNLEVLTNEIDKMLINFSEPTQINSDHIQQYIGINKDYNNFELTKALSYRDVLKANRIINYFSQNPKSNPLIPIIALIYLHFSRLLLIHDPENRNFPERELATKLKVNPYFVKEYMIASKNYSLGKVIENITYIKEADLRSKGVGTTGMVESEILKELIFKLMH
ncbi:DNA polymerase III subunit delta [Echinicola jeungdonensis]|uniref:DNA polymerase III subunit delta n=1 Tax=Echinicola jeungdonensis TaxID=709343 RepID=A0ABV5J5J1_9BACT|nr:DNA polymerase III subunit delta [Echinicola jeungdonensis]MDN3670882.1 DNA polymerase III subunit delta [Echinicola jeungdonensis]